MALWNPLKQWAFGVRPQVKKFIIPQKVRCCTTGYEKSFLCALHWPKNTA